MLGGSKFCLPLQRGFMRYARWTAGIGAGAYRRLRARSLSTTYRPPAILRRGVLLLAWQQETSRRYQIASTAYPRRVVGRLHACGPRFPNLTIVHDLFSFKHARPSTCGLSVCAGQTPMRHVQTRGCVSACSSCSEIRKRNFARGLTRPLVCQLCVARRCARIGMRRSVLRCSHNAPARYAVAPNAGDQGRERLRRVQNRDAHAAC